MSHQTRTGERASLAWLACGLCVLFTTACGDEAVEVIGEERGWRSTRSLFVPPAEYTILDGTDQATVKVHFVHTRDVQVNQGVRLALEVGPPGGVRFELPGGLHPEARLFVELGFGNTPRPKVARCEVEFEILRDESLAVSRRLSRGLPTDTESTLWTPVEVPLAGASTVTLRARLREKTPQPVTAVFASCEIREPVELVRTRASRKHPNVLLIVIDTLRADRLEPYGYDRPTSPNLERIAAGGLLFANALAPAPWTPPSTASLMCGLDPLHHGTLDRTTMFFAYEHLTMAEVCRGAGLRTAAFIANPILPETLNFDQGFEEYREVYWATGIELAEDARAWMEERAGERFFLYLHLMDPHRPYSPSKEFEERLSGPIPPGYEPGAAVAMMFDKYRGNTVDDAVLGEYIAHESDKYDGEVAGSDAAVGAIFQALEELGIRDRTVVAITSDHGEAFGENGRLAHGNGLIDEMLRIPLVFCGPGVPEGERRLERVELQDTGRTLLELAGVSGAGLMEGTDLLAMGGGSRTKELRFSSTWNGVQLFPEEGRLESVGRMLRVESPEWTMIWTPREDGEADDTLLLYESAVEPGSRTDVASLHPEVVRELREAIVAWMDSSQRRRHASFSGEATLDLLRDLGYVSDD